jgi:hypothetical protein
MAWRGASAASRRHHSSQQPQRHAGIEREQAAALRRGGRRDQSAKVLLPRLAKALSKPGISRKTIFGKSRGRAVSAYSMDPSNPEQLLREDAQGRRTVGRMVNGRFRPTRSST